MHHLSMALTSWLEGLLSSTPELYSDWQSYIGKCFRLAYVEVLSIILLVLRHH